MFRLPGSLGKEDNLNKEEKKELVAGLKDRFSSAKAVVLTDYKGLTVEEISEARSKFRESKIEYRVVKNTLAKIASDDTPIALARDRFEGPVGVAIGFDDPVVVAKSVLEYAKVNEKFEVKCGVIEGSFLEASELKKIATLPSREMLLSMMAGAFSAPMSKLAAGLNATVARLGFALEALKSKKTE
jgi:large subunit ribosomal protein L10